MHDTLIMHRIDSSRNMARFYALSVEPTLFGDISLTRRWGRIGACGLQIVELHKDVDGATVARDRWLCPKQRRGYQLVK